MSQKLTVILRMEVSMVSQCQKDPTTGVVVAKRNHPKANPREKMVCQAKLKIVFFNI